METEAIRQFGLAAGLLIVIVAGIGWFFARRMWPWVTGQFEAFAVERRVQMEEFRKTLELNNRTSEMIVEKLSELNIKVGSIHDATQYAGRKLGKRQS